MHQMGRRPLRIQQIWPKSPVPTKLNVAPLSRDPTWTFIQQLYSSLDCNSFCRGFERVNSCIRHRQDIVCGRPAAKLNSPYESSDRSARSPSVFIISLYEIIHLTLSQQKSTARKFEYCTKYRNTLRLTASHRSHRSRTAPWPGLFTKNIIFTDSEITAV